MKPKVLVVIVAKDLSHMPCMDSVNNQDYPNYNVIVHVQKPEEIHFHPTINRSKNIALNRNACNKLALGSDAQYFLLIDYDIILPKDAISRLVNHNKDAVAGWYKINDNHDRWVAGEWQPNDALYQYDKPQPGLVEVDFAGLGCLLLSRTAMASAMFEDGWNKTCYNNVLNKRIHWGPCVDFGYKLKQNGFRIYMDGDVICGHMEKPNTSKPFAMPGISIITVFKDKPECTKRLIESITCNDKMPYQLILIDNNSKEENSEYFKTLSSWYYKFNNDVGLGKAWNKGIELATYEYLLIIDNDAILPFYNWGRILQIELNEYHAGMIFPKIDNVISPINRGHHQGDKTACVLPFKQFSNGSAMFTKKSILSKVGNFDEEYTLGGADLDIQCRLWNRNYDIYTTDKVYIPHLGKATIGELDYKKIWKEGEELVIKKWGEAIKKESVGRGPAPQSVKDPTV